LGKLASIVDLVAVGRDAAIRIEIESFIGASERLVVDDKCGSGLEQPLSSVAAMPVFAEQLGGESGVGVNGEGLAEIRIGVDELRIEAVVVGAVDVQVEDVRRCSS
jgi:hypothetical protein